MARSVARTINNENKVQVRVERLAMTASSTVTTSTPGELRATSWAAEDMGMAHYSDRKRAVRSAIGFR